MLCFRLTPCRVHQPAVWASLAPERSDDEFGAGFSSSRRQLTDRQGGRRRSCIIWLPEPIVTNGFGKAFGPIINTGPVRSHLCLRPDTLASHIRASVSEQIPIHTVCTRVVSLNSLCELHRGQSQT
ncbi:unnamed protein product [Pleuronectes platessa]|uniref:Uncharacterized protein n=1 Tax=Pleuronectes platessa TaxID=8262 RepID=A0A9N7VME2_PLEPL|nr:unnamed protein product [Pleuronectes platessa]